MKNNEILGNDLTIVNQILPHKNKWAFDLYLKGCANNWMPTEISMQKDVEQWKSNVLSNDERLIVKRCMGFFAGSESLVSNNLLLTIFRYVCDAECRQYITRQIFEESLHNLTVVYVCDSLSLDVKEIYEAYSTIPSIERKDSFLMQLTKKIYSSDFNIETIDGKRQFLRNLITYYILCEGLFFYAGFAALLSFGRRNILPGICEQIQYTLRDEAIHIEFGLNLINAICNENPELNSEFFSTETCLHIRKTVQLELDYAKDILPNGILGINLNSMSDYLYFLGNRRCQQLNLPKLFNETENPFPWLSEIIELPKMKNFFETRVIEYQTGGAIDDF